MVVETNGVVTQDHPVMRWGAVWAGWLVATGIAALLYAFGLAVGFSAFNPQDPAAIARGISGGAMAWMILTWAASMWLGAMFAAWFDGRNDTEMGVTRGLAMWFIAHRDHAADRKRHDSPGLCDGRSNRRTAQS